MGTGIEIDADRLWASLAEMAKIGATAKGGVCRVAFTEEDRRARDLFRTWCEDAGCTVRTDRFGNMFARRPGRDAAAAPVMMGSHLDSQVTGGRFDGVYGVMGALEAVRRFNDLGIETDAPVEIVNWTNEEGCVFKPMIGSEVYTGAMPLDDALAMTDRDGRTLKDALEGIGHAGDAPIPGPAPLCYFELHIEQGPILEERGMDIGVVTGGQAQFWYDIVIEGQEAHAGPTPMRSRRDAMVGAARLIVECSRIGNAHDGKATNGHIRAEPNSPNVIAGTVRMTADLRHEDAATLARMDEEMREASERIAAEVGVSIDIDRRVAIPRVPFHPALVGAVREAAQAAGVTHMDIVSGAGHDALNMALVHPTTMIFVPCENGISHNEAENIEKRHAAAGAQVLANAALAAATGKLAL